MDKIKGERMLLDVLQSDLGLVLLSMKIDMVHPEYSESEKIYRAMDILEKMNKRRKELKELEEA